MIYVKRYDGRLAVLWIDVENNQVRYGKTYYTGTTPSVIARASKRAPAYPLAHLAVELTAEAGMDGVYEADGWPVSDEELTRLRDEATRRAALTHRTCPVCGSRIQPRSERVCGACGLDS